MRGNPEMKKDRMQRLDEKIRQREDASAELEPWQALTSVRADLDRML